MKLTESELISLSTYRKSRVQDQLRKNGCAGILLYDPLNVRYATGSTNMQVFSLHFLTRYVLVLTDGPTIMFESSGSTHLLDRPEVLIDEVRDAQFYFHMLAGERVRDLSKAWADEINDLVSQHAGKDKRLAVDVFDPAAMHALQSNGFQIEDGQPLMELARLIKSEDELKAIRHAVSVGAEACKAMRAVLKPGITEQYLWSHFHQKSIELGGEWMETRLLSSGPRTNPWFQECGERVIEEGDIVSFDTDFIGPYGYCVDISRTWVCGDTPTDDQKSLYRDAYELLQEYKSHLKVGVGFREYAELCGPCPEHFNAQKYAILLHGIGMADEYPAIPFIDEFDTCGTEGVFEPNMTVCVETYAGIVGGPYGVKIEDQILITESGIEVISSDIPYEEDWLNG